MPTPKIAIVADWLTNMGGAEPTLLELHRIFPEAPIYTSVYDKRNMPAFADCDIRTTWMQRWLPRFIRYKHPLWPVLRAYTFPLLDLSQYDIIISAASAEAKAVRKHPGAVHICYCHTPTRYYWSHYDEFKREFNFGPLTILIRPFIPLFVRWMRQKDLAAVKGVDYFIANSHATAARIKKYYHRDSTVIFPPVDVARFSNRDQKAKQRRGFIMWGRHVPYKRFDLAIQACNQLGLPLTIVGNGPDTARLKKLSGPTITFTGYVSDTELVHLAQTSQAFLFPGEEDFGISPVEAMAAGLPVIAYKNGGALDYVERGRTGLFFAAQTPDSLISAINEFEKIDFDSKKLIAKSQQFSEQVFIKNIKNFLHTAKTSRTM
jgi:glycosyltransferase involved in cell wall biosynthesis